MGSSGLPSIFLMAATRWRTCSPLTSMTRSAPITRTSVPQPAAHSVQTAGCQRSSPIGILCSGTRRGMSASLLPQPVVAAPAVLTVMILKKSRRSMVRRLPCLGRDLVVACGAILRGPLLPVAGQTGSHVVVHELLRGLGLGHVAVAGFAFHVRADVRGVVEFYERLRI